MSLEGYLVSIDSVRSLTPRLLFRIELEKKEQHEMRVLGISGSIRLKTSQGFVPFGSLNSFLGLGFLYANKPRNIFELTFDLDYHKLEIIEEERKGGDLWLILNVGVIYFDAITNQPFHKIMHGENITIKTPSGSTDLQVPQSQWIKMLDQMGYRRFRTVEIPIPEPPQGTVIDSTLKHLDEAKKSFDEGDYDDVLSNCRKAVEEIEKAVKEEKIDLNLILDQSESKTEKVESLLRRVKDFLNLGPHIGVKVDRRDAEMSLLFTLGLVRYLAKKVIKKTFER